MQACTALLRETSPANKVVPRFGRNRLVLPEILVLVLFGLLLDGLPDLLLVEGDVLFGLKGDLLLEGFELINGFFEVVSLLPDKLLEVRLYVVLHLLLHHEDMVFEETKLSVDVV